MSEQSSSLSLVDRYLRDEMTEAEMAAFEDELMDSPELQTELETALALQELLAAEQVPDGDEDAINPQQTLSGLGQWQGLAIAASVFLAVFSTVMFWKVSNEASGLQQQLDELSQPRSHVLTVPLNIMRSAGNQAPDVIVQKPLGRAAIVLDIELTPIAQQLESVAFALSDQDDNPIAEWVATPNPDGHARVLIHSELVPATRLWLQISTVEGKPLDKRLLEFR